VLYQPGHGRFAVTDPAALLGDLSRIVPATLVTVGPGGFRTTILPMLFDRIADGTGVLRGHLARGNPQWRELETPASALAIFHGPDAYVTPAWYAEKQRTGKVVPTWNYVTVQAQGALSVQHDPAWLVAHVRELVERHESAREDPWSVDDAPPGYIETQARAIVGLELRITRLEGKRKLSQNRDDDDVRRVIAGLDDGTPEERGVAAAMRIEREAGEAP
jgi:transcriptional regulator